MLPAPGPRTAEAFAAFARELDDIRDAARARLGADDARYIVRLLWAIRGLEAAGRLTLLAAAALSAWQGSLTGGDVLGCDAAVAVLLGR